MSEHKTTVEVFYNDMWNRADTSLIPEIFHAGFTFRGSLGPVLVGHEQFAGYVDQVVSALADYTCDILEMTEEGDRVVAKMLFHGLHREEMMGAAPTGKRVEWHGSAHFTFTGAKVSDLWVLGDVHGLLQQLQADRA
jgi:predicted ester cyclase